MKYCILISLVCAFYAHAEEKATKPVAKAVEPAPTLLSVGPWDIINEHPRMFRGGLKIQSKPNGGEEPLTLISLTKELDENGAYTINVEPNCHAAHVTSVVTGEGVVTFTIQDIWPGFKEEDVKRINARLQQELGLKTKRFDLTYKKTGWANEIVSIKDSVVPEAKLRKLQMKQKQP